LESNFFHSFPSGNKMPVPVHFPNRFLGPPFGVKSMRISSSLDGMCTTSPVRLRGVAVQVAFEKQRLETRDITFQVQGLKCMPDLSGLHLLVG
jgi:hypothetical protein